MDVEVRSALTDAEDGKCITDLELLLQKIQQRAVILLEEMSRSQFGDLQSHTVLDRSIRKDQELDGYFGDHIGMLSVIAGYAQRVADFYVHTINSWFNSFLLGKKKKKERDSLFIMTLFSATANKYIRA